MADLSTHYKERQPLETVQIIQNFFSKQNLITKESDINETEAGTWYCHIDLYQNDIYLAGGHGKGVSKEYALASGYAELYERFCNGMVFLANPYFNRVLTDYNKEHFGYYLRANEKELTYDEIVNNTNRTKIYFNRLTSNIPNLTKKVIDFITDGKRIGLPYKNIRDDNDVVYVDPRVLLRVARSVGMTTGNTLEEALVQGLSEIVEKNAQKQLFMDFTGMHYAINLDKIENPILQKFIQNIKKEGYDLYLFDLSYNYDTPVLMSLLMDKKQGIMNINFGAFPVFDIAAERVLTELYQGIKTYHSPEYCARLQIPYRMFINEDLFEIYGNGIDGRIFPADFFNNIIYKDTYNTEIFVNTNTSNTELLQYYRELSEKLELKFYYINNSLSKDICAIQIFVDSENEDIIFHGAEAFRIEWNNQKVIEVINLLNKLMTMYDYIYPGKQISGIDLLKMLIDYSMLGQDTGYVLIMLQLWSNVLISSVPNLFLDILYPLMDSNQQIDTIQPIFTTSPIYLEFKKYNQLRKYISIDLYNIEEILNIFNTIFNYNLSLEDIENGQNSIYLIKKAYLDPMKKYINSEEYKNLIQIFANVLHS